MNIRNFLLEKYNALKGKVYIHILCVLFFEKKYKKIKEINIKTIKNTAYELLNTNKSIGRFGDGELSWMLGENNGVDNFEKASKQLSNRLVEVFNSNRDDFIVTLPDAMNNIEEKKFTSSAITYWKIYFTRESNKLSKILNKNKEYYNTSVTRPYIDYNTNSYARETFSILKEVWKNKKILIVEGNQSRLGYNDDLFNNCDDIKRIECPVTNAFESYDLIFQKVEEFLDNNPDYLTLISLGPTATVLSYDLCKNGHRALDIGHIDVEYEWYLMGAKEKINLPDKYVNEVAGKKEPDNLIDKSHDDEIISKL